MRLTESEYAELQKARPGRVEFKPEPYTPKHKYSAKRTETDGINFDSKKEAGYYVTLKARVHSGEVVFFLRQVPFHLPGGTKYTVDFMEFHRDGSIRFVDVKGMKTKEFVRAKKQVEAIYPVLIEVV